MPHTTITLPDTVSLRPLVAWNKELWKASNEPEIRLDFRNTRFFTPFAMMFILQQIESYRTQFKASIIVLENYKHLDWPEQMGFFATLGDTVFGGANFQIAAVLPDTQSLFLPITTIRTKEFKDQSGRSLTEVNEAVDSEAARLATSLTRLGSGYAFDTVQYSLREIIRNVFEHSGSEYVRFCAQYWPKNRKAELIIADCGMSVFASLSYNPAFKKLGTRDALHFACLPGVSGNAQAMKERSSGNPWRNSGYGLYMTSRLCRNDGDFLIISNDHALVLNSAGKTDFEVTNTRGTLIRLHLNSLTSEQTLRTNLARYTEEGKALAQEIRGAKVIEASAASQMLRRDFNRAADPIKQG